MGRAVGGAACLPNLKYLCVAQCSPALSRLAPKLRVIDLRSDDIGISHLSQREPHDSVRELRIGLPRASPGDARVTSSDAGRYGAGAGAQRAAPPLLAFAHLPGPGSFPGTSKVVIRGGGQLLLQLLQEVEPMFSGGGQWQRQQQGERPRLAHLTLEWAAADGPGALGSALRRLLPSAVGLERLDLEVFGGATAGGCGGGCGWSDEGVASLAMEVLGARPVALGRVELVLPRGMVWDVAVGGPSIEGVSWAGCMRLMGVMPWLVIRDAGGWGNEEGDG